MFESSVNSDSTQTVAAEMHEVGMFESSVNSDSTQTKIWTRLVMD